MNERDIKQRARIPAEDLAFARTAAQQPHAMIEATMRPQKSA
jgi:hypothetical protein